MMIYGGHGDMRYCNGHSSKQTKFETEKVVRFKSNESTTESSFYKGLTRFCHDAKRSVTLLLLLAVNAVTVASMKYTSGNKRPKQDRNEVDGESTPTVMDRPAHAGCSGGRGKHWTSFQKYEMR
jgi:hypothetical protein